MYGLLPCTILLLYCGMNGNIQKHRLIFKPMEKLSIQNIGSVKVDSVEIEDELDIRFKPGFYKQTESFVNDIDDGRKKTIQDQLRSWDYYEKIDK